MFVICSPSSIEPPSVSIPRPKPTHPSGRMRSGGSRFSKTASRSIFSAWRRDRVYRRSSPGIGLDLLPLPRTSRSSYRPFLDASGRRRAYPADRPHDPRPRCATRERHRRRATRRLDACRLRAGREPVRTANLGLARWRCFSGSRPGWLRTIGQRRAEIGRACVLHGSRTGGESTIVRGPCCSVASGLPHHPRNRRVRDTGYAGNAPNSRGAYRGTKRRTGQRCDGSRSGLAKDGEVALKTAQGEASPPTILGGQPDRHADLRPRNATASFAAVSVVELSLLWTAIRQARPLAHRLRRFPSQWAPAAISRRGGGAPGHAAPSGSASRL